MNLKPPTQTIMHIDFNSFFASVEQQANPFIRNKSMGVGKRNYQGSAILAASYLAKRQGIGLATRYNEAKRIDPTFELAELDMLKYYDINQKFIKLISKYAPCIEVYSVDEVFLDLTSLYLNQEDLLDMAFEIKQQIIQNIGEVILCSIGIAPNKLLAKVASNHDKPDGITYISWQDRYQYLDKLDLKDIWGIGQNTTKKMYKNGIHSLRQIREIKNATLYSIIGGYYKRLKLLADGYNFEPIRSINKPAQSMQHAHTLSTKTKNKQILCQLAHKLSEKLATRLRYHNQKAKCIYIGLIPANSGDYGWGSVDYFHQNIRLTHTTNSGMEIFTSLKEFIQNLPLDKSYIRRIIIGVYDLSIPGTISFDDLESKKTNRLLVSIDLINKKFGEFTIRNADILYEYSKENELKSLTTDMRFHTM